MQERYMHPFYGEIVYEESFWSGKKIITIDGQELQKVSKNKFLFNGKEVLVKGSVAFGAKLCFENETIELTKKPTWYEITLAILPLLFLIIWGNVPELCLIFPVVGGALGGALGAVAGIVYLLLVKKMKNPAIKILFGLGMFVGAIFTAFITAVTLLLFML